MPGNFKSETLSRILNEARDAKPLDNNKRKHIYSPDEYNKMRAEILALDQVSNSEYLIPQHEFGAIEFDDNGNLKEIGRNRPAMLDLAYYTRNRYEVEKIIPANEKKSKLPRGTYILVVLGNPIVKAISDVVELPKTVKAYRFKREAVQVPVAPEELPETQTEEDSGTITTLEPTTKTAYIWKYVGAEMITSDRVYKMTKQIDPLDMMHLMDQIEGDLHDGENVGGDKLDDIE